MAEQTSIPCDPETADRLWEFKGRAQTWDELLLEMADVYEESEDS